MQLDFKKTVYQIKYEGQQYELRCPSVYELREFLKLSDGKNDSEKFDETIALLERLGLPKSVSNQLELGQVEMLMELFNSKKK
jgi:hypothetical protein